MKKFIKKNYKEKIIFHFGDFCDALVYDDLINSVEFFSEKIKKYNNVYIEYRTKSNNYKLLLDMKTKKNIIIGYSLSSDEIITKFEKKTVNLDKRINALREIQQSGFLISIHFDPIIFYNNLLEDYKNLVKHLRKKISNENLFSISAGTLRMPKKVYKAIKNKSSATVLKKLKKEKSMYRYPENVRKKINRKMKKMILNNFDTDKVYICMD
jgi:spore photoproduct lyase